MLGMDGTITPMSGPPASGESTRVIRPAAVLREQEAVRIQAALEAHDVSRGGVWNVGPGLWQRYDQPWDGVAGMVGTSRLMGTIGVIYGSPSRHEITIYRVTVSGEGANQGWTVETLCDDALAFVGMTLEECPRAELKAPPTPDPFHRRS
jgi:hypothetical protein